MKVKIILNKANITLNETQRPGPGHQQSKYERQGEVIEFDGWGGATDVATGNSGAVVETDTDQKDLKLKKHLDKEKSAGKINGKGLLLGDGDTPSGLKIKIKRNR